MWPIRLRRTRRVRDLDAAAVADHPLVLHPAVLAAGALPVLLGPEDPLAEQAVLLGAVGPVVDRLRLLDLAERPAPDVVRAGQPDLDGPVVVDTIVGTFAHAHETLSSATRLGVPKRGELIRGRRGPIVAAPSSHSGRPRRPGSMTSDPVATGTGPGKREHDRRPAPPPSGGPTRSSRSSITPVRTPAASWPERISNARRRGPRATSGKRRNFGTSGPGLSSRGVGSGPSYANAGPNSRKNRESPRFLPAGFNSRRFRPTLRLGACRQGSRTPGPSWPAGTRSRRRWCR